jgi:hypothetical protein
MPTFRAGIFLPEENLSDYDEDLGFEISDLRRT